MQDEGWLNSAQPVPQEKQKQWTPYSIVLLDVLAMLTNQTLVAVGRSETYKLGILDALTSGFVC